MISTGAVFTPKSSYTCGMMLGSKGFLTPLIPDRSALCAPAILKNIHSTASALIGLLFHVFGGSQGQRSWHRGIAVS